MIETRVYPPKGWIQKTLWERALSAIDRVDHKTFSRRKWWLLLDWMSKWTKRRNLWKNCNNCWYKRQLPETNHQQSSTFLIINHRPVNRKSYQPRRSNFWTKNRISCSFIKRIKKELPRLRRLRNKYPWSKV